MLLTDDESQRGLIAAILHQALIDAQSFRPDSDPEGARRFINANTILFCDYCYLLDLDPLATAERMWKVIDAYDMKYFRGKRTFRNVQTNMA